jgi:hypothetical protein
LHTQFLGMARLNSTSCTRLEELLKTLVLK